ncbi:MAG: YihY/virulence factor BrkB family protein, partial [Anaerolineaceae bacterium]|nr:YihY/virulence factor BrkB family protein [Anaerolineaceae bacterium]
MQKLLQWVKTNIQPVQILKNLWFLFKDTFTQWSQDKAARMSAGLAYYTTFSMAPLLLIVIFITGLVLGPAAAEGRIITEISSVVGNQAAQTIQEIIKNANRPFPGVIATIIGVLTMLYGASGMFAQIQDSLDTIWKVPIKENPKPFDFLRTRSVSFLMVVASGVLLLSMVMFSTVQATIAKYFSQYIPTTESFWELNNFLFTFLIITFLFAAVFKIIPRIRIQWRDVWIGAAFTALLFNGSKVLISLYLGNS